MNDMFFVDVRNVWACIIIISGGDYHFAELVDCGTAIQSNFQPIWLSEKIIVFRGMSSR